ncbi:MAG: hypothetical protein ACE5H9_12655 [Anaerolineae bacterium]
MYIPPYSPKRTTPAYERISLVVSLTLIGLALYFVIDLPARTFTLQLFGSPLTLNVSQRWLMAALLGGLAGSGAAAVVRLHPGARAHDLPYAMTFWILPGSVVILATLTLALAATPLQWAIGLGLSGLLLWLIILAEYHTVDCEGRAYNLARMWLSAVSYGLILAFFVLIYHTRARSALSATGTFLIGGAIALGLLRTTPEQIRRTWVYSALIALGIGQLTWTLNYWRLNAAAAGLLLLLAFYLMTGLAGQELKQGLNRRAAFEFLAVALIGLFVVVNFAT